MHCASGRRRRRRRQRSVTRRQLDTHDARSITSRYRYSRRSPRAFTVVRRTTVYARLAFSFACLACCHAPPGHGTGVRPMANNNNNDDDDRPTDSRQWQLVCCWWWWTETSTTTTTGVASRPQHKPAEGVRPLTQNAPPAHSCGRSSTSAGGGGTIERTLLALHIWPIPTARRMMAAMTTPMPMDPMILLQEFGGVGQNGQSDDAATRYANGEEKPLTHAKAPTRAINAKVWCGHCQSQYPGKGPAIAIGRAAKPATRPTVALACNATIKLAACYTHTLFSDPAAAVVALVSTIFGADAALRLSCFFSLLPLPAPLVT
jgi:hypothetical protein